jgi:hypothetical protein
LDQLLAWTLRQARRRGLVGQSTPWLVVGLVALGIRQLRRDRSATPVVREVLRAGERLVVEVRDAAARSR